MSKSDKAARSQESTTRSAPGRCAMADEVLNEA